MKITDTSSIFQYPAYMKLVYGDVYDVEQNYLRRDKVISCNLRTFFQYANLVEELNDEISEGQNVCQLGVVFGNQIEKTASIIGCLGVYDIIDVNIKALQQVNKKYGKQYKQIKCINNDAALIKVSATRDVVICFMLLSMVPPVHRKKIINNALKMLKPGGKAIFIDWHKPKNWNLLGWIMKFYNRLYNPFVEAMQNNTIKYLSENPSLKDYVWKQKSFFGGMFQKTVVTRRKSPKTI